MKKLRWSDVWLLVASYIAFQKGRCRVQDVLAVADTMDHAVANFEEISSAMVRLEEHGYVQIEKTPWRIICTEKAIEIVKPIADNNSLAYKIWKELEKKLGVPSWIPGEPLPHPENDLRYNGFGENEYKKEVDDYLESMKSG